MFKYLIAILVATTGFGELRNFQIGSISYEWETLPNYNESREVFMNAFIDGYGSIPLEAFNKSSREELNQWIGVAFDEYYFMNAPQVRWLTAKENGTFVGCLAIEMEKYPEEIYLAQMAIDPAFQRQGIGTAMIRSIIEQESEVSRFVVITRKVNQAATEFYHSLGFIDSDYIHEGYSKEIYTGFEFKR
ncbi:MAG: GNAT family N-acetyltransferase [Parachlamydiales bacterium]|nr:GNAT family N-acetyltransferase [Parachlamydiales bacterium]